MITKLLEQPTRPSVQGAKVPVQHFELVNAKAFVTPEQEQATPGTDTMMHQFVTLN